MTESLKQFLHRFISRVVPVEREELPALIWSFVYFFCVLAAYYILRPVRDEMGVLSGAHKLPWLFSVVFVTMLAVIPIFGWVAGHFTIRRLLPTVYAFFILNLLIFFVALQSGIGLQSFGPIFFVWLSVFNLFVVSVFWSFMADVFPTGAARRLFGCISAGGSLGAMTGPFITAMAVKGVGVSGLLLVSAVFLLIAVGCMLALLKWYHSHHGVDLGNRHLSSIKNPEAISPGLWIGVLRIVRSPYLKGIALYLMCYSILSTFLYSQQTILIPQVMPSSEDRMQLFASVDLGINVLAFTLQFFATGWLLTRFGVVIMLAVMPMVSFVGFGVFGLVTVLPVLIGFGVLRRAGEFSITKPTRETLFTVVPREEKYQAKNVIDTVVHRGADMTGTGIVSIFHGWGMSLSAMSFAALPIAGLWVAIGIWLGRRHEAIRRQ
ncbi:MAG TPA: Npt1/Npt2 family nucleotide transporter [Nitrospirales bacterium]|nr:Npt1/Npt2 family nucleotide transporter [Nitrospirales bacterium]